MCLYHLIVFAPRPAHDHLYPFSFFEALDDVSLLTSERTLCVCVHCMYKCGYGILTKRELVLQIATHIFVFSLVEHEGVHSLLLPENWKTTH